MSRVVRQADRVTGRTVKEHDVTGKSPAEVEVWFRAVGRTWDTPRYALVLPDHFETQAVAA